MANMRVRVRGIDSSTRSLASISDETREAAHDACTEAAEYLRGKIEDKIGRYQSTGGPGNGPWPSLKQNTVKRHLKIGKGDTPLDYTGELKGSFYVQEGGKGRLAAQVKSTCKYLVHHIYGAPRAHVPQRDPMMCTATEEKKNCRAIVRKRIDEVIRRNN